jgi:hypothetical protein
MEGFFQNHEQDEAGHADGVHAHAGPKQAYACDPRVSYPLEPREGFQMEPLTLRLPRLRRRGDESVSEGHREFDYLEWIARLTSHIPERYPQLVHYYGAYSNAHRGIAARREVFEVKPTAAESPAG